MSPKMPRTHTALPTFTYELKTPCGKMFARFTHDEINGKKCMQEVFISATAGSCAYCMISALTRTISRALRQTAVSDPEYPLYAAKDLLGHSCPHVTFDKTSCVNQLGEAIAEEYARLQTI